jgi:cytochrome b561
MPRSRYTLVAILFHWVIAALILANLYFGWRMGFVKGLAQFNIFQLHKSIGITVLLLSLLRLGWRLINPPPPEDASLKPWEKLASTAVHWGFYVIMIGMPLSGWIVVSTSPMNIPTLLYHTIPWPHFPGVHTLPDAAKTSVNHSFDLTHVSLAFGAVGLLVLHVGAVVKHQFLDGHPVIGRMLPTTKAS